MKIEHLIFVLSVAIGAYLFGALAMRLDLFPSNYIKSAIEQVQHLENKNPHFLYPAIYKTSGSQILDEDRIQSGVTLITSYWPDFEWRAGIKLIDANGQILHQWKTDPAEIWPDRLSSGVAEKYVHGSYLFPNGDILFNIEYEGLVRMDSCGKIVWKQDFSSHHSISPTENGNFWVSVSVLRGVDASGKKYLQKYNGLKAPVFEDHILKISPGGEILRDINLLDIVFENGLNRYLIKIARKNTGDIFHLNDVEELSSEMAGEYPLFEAGDVLVSLRYLSLVLVIDPESKAVKWYATDPFFSQHDPDFVGNGWITLFDNNLDHTVRGSVLGGSKIVALNPESGAAKQIYPTELSEPFYTGTGGKWQQLDNGNILVVEAQAGRIFESDDEGNTVWQWVHEQYNDSLIPEVLEGTRYAYTPDQISKWQCASVN